MAGNVEQWVADNYDDTYYQNSESYNPLGGSGDKKVIRGGDWGVEGFNLRVSARSGAGFSTFYALGFRCARTR